VGSQLGMMSLKREQGVEVGCGRRVSDHAGGGLKCSAKAEMSLSTEGKSSEFSARNV
jgi:hypothetical protein